MGFFHFSMTLAIVNVFPDPVTPIKHWNFLPAARSVWSFSMAAGWSPRGVISEMILKSGTEGFPETDRFGYSAQG